MPAVATLRTWWPRCTICGKRCPTTVHGTPQWSRGLYGAVGEPRCSQAHAMFPVTMTDVQAVLVAQGDRVMAAADWHSKPGQAARPDWREDYEAWLRETWTPRGPVRHLVVRRRDGRDGITWDVLQAIKNEMLGPDVTAVEVFPPAADLVNEVNYRHLWEVPDDFPFNMRRLADWS